VRRPRIRNIRIRASYPVISYMGPPLYRETVEHLAAHDTRKGYSHISIMKRPRHYEVSVLSVNPSRYTGRVNPLTPSINHQYSNKIAFGTPPTIIECRCTAMSRTGHNRIHILDITRRIPFNSKRCVVTL